MSIPPPEEWEIRECDNELEEDDKTVEVIEAWEPLDLAESEGKEMRVFLTRIVFLIWAAWILTGLIKAVITGDGSLLVIGSPLVVLLRYIVAFYFHIHRG